MKLCSSQPFYKLFLCHSELRPVAHGAASHAVVSRVTSPRIDSVNAVVNELTV